jgi:hypothetical protein
MDGSIPNVLAGQAGRLRAVGSILLKWINGKNDLGQSF